LKGEFMPRKDRRFTGEDVRRIYCNNLTPLQRYFFDITDCNWSQYSTHEQLKKVFQSLFDSDLLEDIVGLLPGGNYINLAMDVIINILEGQGITLLDLIPVWDLESMLGEKNEELLKKVPEPVPRTPLLE
jgi:hypothetical protein